jgi:hypothetical protein
MWRSIVICPLFVPAVVIVSLSAMIAGWSSSDRGTWRAEGVGRLRKPPALEPSTHSYPETPISRFQAAPFPPAKIATAHWAARDHPHLDLFMQAHELLPIVATPPSTCTTNPLRLAPLCLSTLLRLICFLPLPFSLHQLQPLHQQRRAALGSSRQHHAYASRRIVGLSAHSTQLSQQIACRYRT